MNNEKQYDTPEEALDALLKPARQADEDTAAYRARRATCNYYVKLVRRGRMFWNSSEDGTYRKPKE